MDLLAGFAVYAAAATPKPIIKRLAAECEKAMKAPAFAVKAKAQGAHPTRAGSHCVRLAPVASIIKL